MRRGWALALACCVLCALGAAPVARGDDHDSGGGETPECKTAVAAQKLLLNTAAALKNKTLPFPDDEDSVPGKDLLALVANASRAPRPATTNGITLFKAGTPYFTWGNSVMMITLSQAMHVPSATLGELSYVAAAAEQSYAAASEKAAANTSSVSAADAFAIWTDSFEPLVQRMRADAEEQPDPLNRRAMLLRAMNYEYASYYPQPTHPNYDEAYRNSLADFKEAMGLFSAYQTSFFSFPYNNGTVRKDLNAFLVTPSPNVKTPTILFMGSVFNWKEVQFMRYGLAALRRGYAVVFFDQPGMGMGLRSAPHMRASSKPHRVVSALLDTIEAVPKLAGVVDSDNVALVGISLGSYQAGKVCSKLTPTGRVKGCVMGTAIYSLGKLALDVVSDRVYGAMAKAALEDSAAFTDPKVAEAMMDAKDNVMRPLLSDCSPDANADQLLGAMLVGSNDPELLYPPLNMLGLVNDTADELVSNYFHALSRMDNDFGEYDASRWRGPVLLLGGEEDYVTGGQEAELARRLVNANVTSHMFESHTGAALAAQIGGATHWEQQVMPFLADLFSSSKGGSLSAASDSNGRR